MTPEQRQKISRRNFFTMICEGSLFWMGVAFIEPTAVVSVFINEYTGSMELAGLAMTLRQAAMNIGMFIMGMHIHRVHDNGLFFRKFALLSRSPIFLVAPVLLLGVGGATAVIWFISMQSLFFFADGFMALCWQRLNANTIASRDRGPIQGYQLFVSALVGMVSASVIKLLMDSPLEQNVRYACIFGICGAIYIVNALVVRTLRDIPPEEPAAPPPRSFSRYIGSFLALWKSSRDFRHIMYGRLLFNGSIMATSLLLLFGKREMGLSDTQISTMIYVQVAGQLVGGPLFGLINRHLGNTPTMILSNTVSALVGALGVALFVGFRGVPLFWPVAALIFLASTQQVAIMGYTNAIYERMPRELLPGYMILQQLVLLPFTALPFLAGVLAQEFTFLPLFALVAALGAAGVGHAFVYRGNVKKGLYPAPVGEERL